jgi:hypothetical protein
MNMSASFPRLEASIHEMKRFYPSFSLSGSPIGTGPVAVWKGWVQPIQSAANLEHLLDDIYYDRPVYVDEGGEVRHLPGCTASHSHHEWMERLSNPYAVYKLEIQYGGSKAHPRAYVRVPSLPRWRWKHIFRDGEICAYPSWEDVWSWETDTVVNYMDHALVWLIKSTVWLQARVWIGAEFGHEPLFLLEAIRPTQECWCGIGEQYGNCHRPSDYAKHLHNIENINNRMKY